MARAHQPSAIPCNRPPREDGTKYRLRDREGRDGNPPTVWGERLTWNEAQKLRDRVTFEKKSRSMIIEPMPEGQAETPTPVDDLSIPEQPAPAAAPSFMGTNYEITSAMRPSPLAADGVITMIPADHRLLVNGVERVVPAQVHQGDTVECVSLSPEAVATRSAATSAVAQVIQQHRRVPLDVTVRQPQPRRSPPPPDLTVSTRPPVVRLGELPVTPPKPPPSPLKVATLEDGEVLPDDAITDAELPDLAGDLGGGPSDADVAHARKQAEAERAQ